MKKPIKRYLPGAAISYRALKKAFKRNDANMEAVFSEICKSNAWQGAESISGPGSDSVNTATIRRELPVLLKEWGARSILDAPCGDLNWMKEVSLAVEQYIGADVVPEVIHQNQSLHTRTNREFRILDITKSKLPQVDLILCRDCLVHFSYEHICSALRRFKKSGSKYLLTTTFTKPRKNNDITTGGWRPLNLEHHPFAFPTPLEIINEQYHGENRRYADKSLGLWELSTMNVAAIVRRIIWARLKRVHVCEPGSKQFARSASGASPGHGYDPGRRC